MSVSAAHFKEVTNGYEKRSDGLWVHTGKLIVRGGPMEGPLRMKAGPPVDADYGVAVDGLMMLDTTNQRLYVRSGGLWKSVVLA